jgi:redox-sensing transcriptional repressor
LEIFDVARLKELNTKLRARIAILAVPRSAAQKVTDDLIEAGIHAILNFAPTILRVPETVVVRNVSFLQELAVLSYHLSHERSEEPAPLDSAEESGPAIPAYNDVSS